MAAKRPRHSFPDEDETPEPGVEWPPGADRGYRRDPAPQPEPPQPPQGQARGSCQGIYYQAESRYSQTLRRCKTRKKIIVKRWSGKRVTPANVLVLVVCRGGQGGESATGRRRGGVPRLGRGRDQPQQPQALTKPSQASTSSPSFFSCPPFPHKEAPLNYTSLRTLISLPPSPLRPRRGQVLTKKSPNLPHTHTTSSHAPPRPHLSQITVH